MISAHVQMLCGRIALARSGVYVVRAARYCAQGYPYREGRVPKVEVKAAPNAERVVAVPGQPRELTWDAAANAHLLLSYWFGVPLFIEPSARRRPAAEGGTP